MPTKKPVIPIEDLLEPKNIKALAGLRSLELRSKLHDLIYGRPLYEYENFTRMIPKRRGAKYPADAIDIHHDEDNGTAIMATKAVYHGPAFPVYKRSLENDYRAVRPDDIAKVKMTPVVYGLHSIETGWYNLFPGYSDGTHFGVMSSGYPFFDRFQMQSLAYHLKFNKIIFDQDGAHIEDSEFGSFTASRVPSGERAGLDDVYWFNEEVDWVWSRPMNLNEVDPEDLKHLAVFDPETRNDLVRPEAFNELTLPIDVTYELVSSYLGGFTFEKKEGSQTCRFFEYEGGVIQLMLDISEGGAIVARVDDSALPFDSKSKVGVIVDQIQDAIIDW